MKNIIEMTDLEMAEELRELKLKLPRIKKHMKVESGNRNIAQEYNIKLQRYKLLNDTINYDNINFKLNAKTFGEHLERLFANNNISFQFGIKRDNTNNNQYLAIRIGRMEFYLQPVDNTIVHLGDVDLDVSDFYLNDEIPSSFKGIEVLITERVLRRIVYESLLECQKSKITVKKA